MALPGHNRTGSPDKSTGAAGSQAVTCVTRSQTARLHSAGVAVQRLRDPEPITVNWLFFNKSRPPACHAVDILHTHLNKPSDRCRGLFVQELRGEHLFEARLRSVKFWRPKGQIPIDMFDKSEWPETFTNAEDVAKMIQGAQYLSDVFEADLDRWMVHLIVTAERAHEARDETRDGIAGLPEIIHFRRNIGYAAPAPSQGARSQNYAENQRQSDGAIYDGRYPHDGNPTTAAPIHIFHPIFEAFLRRLHCPTAEPTRRYLKLVRKIMDLLTQIHPPEWKRGRDFRDALGGVLGHTLVLEANDDEARTDGDVVIEVAGIRIRLCITEIKAEVGEGGCDPSTQAGLSLRKFWVTQEDFFPIRDKTCCPTILLAGGGAWLTVLGAVFTDRPIVQRLTDMLWFGNSTTHREDRLLHLAYLFLALRDSIQDLATYYTDIATNQDIEAFNKDSNEPHPRFFPYVTSVDTPTGLIQFKYLGRLQDDASCVTFRAKPLDDSKDIVVKFVTSYNAKVHDLLHDRGWAPKLLYHGPIPTTSTILDAIPLPDHESAKFRRLLPLLDMVVMEYIDPGEWPNSREVAHEQLKDVLKFLHDNGYVFGDLRKPNVLFTEQGKLNLIDFDWAGVYKQSESVGSDEYSPVDWEYAYYPAGLSGNISWAKGVDDFAAIHPEHDIEMMNKLLDVQYQQQEH